MSSTDPANLSLLWRLLKERTKARESFIYEDLLQDLLERVEALEENATVLEPPPDLKTKLTILIAQQCQTVRVGQSYEPIACEVLKLVAGWLDSGEGLPESVTPNEADGWELAASVLFSEAHR